MEPTINAQSIQDEIEDIMQAIDRIMAEDEMVHSHEGGPFQLRHVCYQMTISIITFFIH